MPDDAQILFTPSGRRGRVSLGTTVLDAARTLGVDIDSVCGGRALCGRCQVEVGSSPSIPARSGSLSPQGASETEYRGRRALGAGRRLSCMAEIRGDVVIDVPPDSQVHRQVVRKRADAVDIPVDPVVRLYYVDVVEPSMEVQASDLRRLLDGLAAHWQLHDLEVDPVVFPQLQDTLRDGKWSVTVAVHDGSTVTAIWPGFRDVALGIAFDVGSTTIAAHLCDLSSGEILASAGAMNPQIRYGEDLMSRVSYVMMNPGGAGELTAVVRRALDDLVGAVTAEAGAERREVLEITIVGNPIMHHLVLGLDPTQLGTAPFALVTDAPVRVPASVVGLDVHPGARLYTLPCIAGHVGADAAGAILSEAPHRSDRIQLLVDVGTNAEIVLGNSHRLLAASSPTGPAFEGAQISSGQRAAPGAIERVRIDRATRRPRFNVIGSDLWSDDPGFADDTAEIGITGICGSGIIEAIAELYLAGVIDADGVLRGPAQDDLVVADGRTFSYVLHDGDPPILITQNDVRAIQLAKAALYAGARLLMDRLDVDTVEEIRLAGAFGSHIDPQYAMVLGLIPDCDLDAVAAAGNAAGTGAIMALLSEAARSEIERVVTTIEKVETAVEPDFQEHFVAAMAIPHKTAPFTKLRDRVELPDPLPTAGATRTRRRRREEGR